MYTGKIKEYLVQFMGVSSEKDTPILYIWASYFSSYKKVGK